MHVPRVKNRESENLNFAFSFCDAEQSENHIKKKQNKNIIYGLQQSTDSIDYLFFPPKFKLIR